MTNTTDTVHPVDVSIHPTLEGGYDGHAVMVLVGGFNKHAQAQAFADKAREKLAEILAESME